jgi:hypothetical protein
MDRQPLYQRVEHLIRSRRAYVVAFWALVGLLVVAPIIWMVVQSLGSGDRQEMEFAVFIAVMLTLVVLSRTVVQRLMGRAARTKSSVRLPARTRWPALDQALDAYAIRTDAGRPKATLMPRSAAGEQIDAELVYAGELVPGAPSLPLRGPLDALPGDAPMLSFTEAMLDSYTADELLAVIAHLLARADIVREGTTRFGNGAREADSRALLLTHDHAALLRALQKCTKSAVTRPPGMGIVLFSDADLQARTRFKEDQPDWDSHDRIAELRAHLMAAGLDVPEAGNTWPTAPGAKLASPFVQGAFGVMLLILALGWLVGLVAVVYPLYQFLMEYPELAAGHIEVNALPILTMVALVCLFGFFGTRMLVGAQRARSRGAAAPSRDRG